MYLKMFRNLKRNPKLSCTDLAKNKNLPEEAVLFLPLSPTCSICGSTWKQLTPT